MVGESGHVDVRRRVQLVLWLSWHLADNPCESSLADAYGAETGTRRALWEARRGLVSGHPAAVYLIRRSYDP